MTNILDDGRLEIIHHSLAGLGIAALMGGLALGDLPLTLPVGLYAAWHILLRIKFWLDDAAYFADVREGKLPRGAPFWWGLGFALLSWLLWGAAAFFVKDITLSATIMIWAVGVSTMWIVAATIKSGAYSEHVPWLFFNALYIGGLYLLAAREADWMPFAAGAEVYATFIGGLLLVTMILDMMVTRILEQRRRLP